MKKILSLVIVLIAIGQVNANGVNPESPVGMSVIQHGSIVKVFYQGEERGKVEVTILNEKGDVVYKEEMNRIENFMRPYNFSRLPEGEYRIELRNEQGLLFETVTHSKAREKRIAYLTRLDKKQNKYMLAVLNDGHDALTIKIYDKYSRLLYKDIQNIEGDFAKVYNLNQVSGEHVFEIIDMDGNVIRLKKSRG